MDRDSCFGLGLLLRLSVSENTPLDSVSVDEAIVSTWGSLTLTILVVFVRVAAVLYTGTRVIVG